MAKKKKQQYTAPVMTRGQMSRRAKEKQKEKDEDEPAKVDDAECSEEAKLGQNGQVEAVDPDVEKEKEARKLAKKLRQAKELKDRKAKGDSLLPEQLEKVIRINELIRQLDTLGFDGNGERKEKKEETLWKESPNAKPAANAKKGRQTAGAGSAKYKEADIPF